MHPISANIIHHFAMWRSFSNWDMGIDIDSEDETSYTMQYQEVFLNYVENEYCAEPKCLPSMQLQMHAKQLPVPIRIASLIWSIIF
jgi:hypothetical protein